MEIKLHNTLTDTKEKFKPINPGLVKMYHCGPTVYNFPSIGNMRSYILADILRRCFEYDGLEVKQVINITDVGHLVGDGDEGEDKVEKEAKKMGKTATEIAKFYEEAFYKDLGLLNIQTSETAFPKATEHIEKQVEIIKILEEKGFTYITSDGVYFDTSRFKDYGKLGKINIGGLLEGARIKKGEKKNPTDFALWKFSKENNRLQEWQSPWGKGFPGWHIECSAMSQEYLGQPFDIHTGGIDHIPVHHNNEIAQSECAFDKPLANFWIHNEFLKVENEKMSKSLGNVFTLEDLMKRKIHPLSFRYWLLTSHYKTPANFTWEGAQGAQNAFEKIISVYPGLPTDHESDEALIAKFETAISDDLNTPIAIALLQEARSKKAIDTMDRIFGLGLKNLAEKMFGLIPEEIKELQNERDLARAEKDWEKSDRLREEIEKEGYILEDKDGQNLIRRKLSSLI